MHFAFQCCVDRQSARELALAKGWDHFQTGSGGRVLNDLGQLIQLWRTRSPQLSEPQFRSQFAQTLDESIDVAISGLPRVSQEVMEHFERDQILCFSEAPDIILMWSYYAQNHAGVVLRFADRSPNSPLRLARQVNYVTQMPALLDDNLLSDMLAGFGGIVPQEVLDQAVWTKSDHWAHEREWRLYSANGPPDVQFEDIPFYPTDLDGVIFGARLSASDRAGLRSLIEERYPHVELLEAVLRNNSYALDIGPVKHG
jgi:hypothetical protein